MFLLLSSGILLILSLVVVAAGGLGSNDTGALFGSKLLGVLWAVDAPDTGMGHGLAGCGFLSGCSCLDLLVC